MRVILHKKNLEITPALQDFVEKKLVEPVRKRLKGLPEEELPILEIEVGRPSRHHLKGRVYHLEANLSLGKNLLRAEVDNEDVRAGCDILKDELLQKLTNYKNKQETVLKKKARRAKEEMVF